MQMSLGLAFLLAAIMGPRHVRASSDCPSGWGKAPKYDDSSCKSYWYCEDYYGRVEYCPHGYQFHYEYKECLKDEDVSCKWQLSYYHSSDISSGSSRSWGSSHGPWSRDCHEEHGKEPDYEAEHCETYYSCHDHHGTLEHCLHGHQFDFHDKECREDKYVYCQEQRMSYSSHASHTSHSEREHPESGHSSSMTSHDCHEEHGKEPDYEAEHCETYYSCHDHHGTLEHCPHGHQFDFHDKECREDKYVYCQEQRMSYSSHTSHDEDHHHSSSGGVDDSLHYMLAMGGLGGLEGAAGGAGGGNGLGGGLLGGLGVPAAAAAAALLNIQGNARVLPIQGNARVLPIQGNARVLPIQGNVLQGVPPNQIGFPPNQVANLPNQVGVQPNQLANLPNQIGFPPNQIGFPPNQIGNLPNQFGVLPNQVGGVGQLLPGLGLAANPFNVGGANVNQIQVAGAAGAPNGVAASQDQDALLSNGVLNAQGGAPVGQTAVDQDQKIIINQQDGAPTATSTNPGEQGRQPHTHSARAGDQPAALPPLVIPAVQVLATRPVSPPMLGPPQSLPTGGAQDQAEPALQGQAQASTKAGVQVEGGVAPDLATDAQISGDAAQPAQVPKPVAERVTTPFWWLQGDHATLPPLDISNGPWLVPDSPSNPWVPVELPNTQGK